MSKTIKKNGNESTLSSEYTEMNDHLDRFQVRALNDLEAINIRSAFKADGSAVEVNKGMVLRDKITGSEVAVFHTTSVENERDILKPDDATVNKNLVKLSLEPLSQSKIDDIKAKNDAGTGIKIVHELDFKPLYNSVPYGDREQALDMIGLDVNDTIKPSKIEINRDSKPDDYTKSFERISSFVEPGKFAEHLEQVEQFAKKVEIASNVDKPNPKGAVLGPIKYDSELTKHKDELVERIDGLTEGIRHKLAVYNGIVDDLNDGGEVKSAQEMKDIAKEQIDSKREESEKASLELMQTVIQPESFRVNRFGGGVEPLDKHALASNFSKLSNNEYMEAKDIAENFVVGKVTPEEISKSTVVNEQEVIAAIKILKKGDPNPVNVFAVKGMQEDDAAVLNGRAEESNADGVVISISDEALSKIGLKGTDFSQGVNGVGTEEYYDKHPDVTQRWPHNATERMVIDQVSPGGISNLVSKKQLVAHNEHLLNQGHASQEKPFNMNEIAVSIAPDGKLDSQQAKSIAIADTQLEIQQIHFKDLKYLNKALQSDGHISDDDVKYSGALDAVVVTNKDGFKGEKKHVLSSHITFTDDGFSEKQSNFVSEKTYSNNPAGFEPETTVKLLDKQYSDFAVKLEQTMDEQVAINSTFTRNDGKFQMVEGVMDFKAESIAKSFANSSYNHDNPSAERRIESLYGLDGQDKHPVVEAHEKVEVLQSPVSGMTSENALRDDVTKSRRI